MQTALLKFWLVLTRDSEYQISTFLKKCNLWQTIWSGHHPGSSLKSKYSLQLIVLFVAVSRAKPQRIWNRWSSLYKTITLSSAQWIASKSTGFKRPMNHIKYSFENRWKKKGRVILAKLYSWCISLSSWNQFAAFCFIFVALWVSRSSKLFSVLWIELRFFRGGICHTM